MTCFGEEDLAENLRQAERKIEGLPPLESMDIKRKRNLGRFSCYALGCLTGLAISGLSYLTLQPVNKDARPDTQAPAFHNIIGEKIGFSDDFAPGMRAYLIHKGKQRELKAESENPHYAMFRIPRDVFNQDSDISVYAIDRDNHVSDVKNLRTLNGFLTDSQN